MDALDERLSLARRHAPILRVYPEIPARRTATSALRSAYLRRETRRASQPTDGGHMTRDFHPCDVRLILDHAQAWEPGAPRLLMPRWFSRAYRDLARFFFWPIAGTVTACVLILAFAQALPPAVRQAVAVGILGVLGVVYVITLRSPILVPLDHWHHLNHAVIGVGLLLAWYAAFGSSRLWLLGPVIVVPTALSFLTSLAMRGASGLANMTLNGLQAARNALLRFPSTGGTSPGTPHTSRLFHGLKAAHEYTPHAELFYRDPHTQEPIHRADQDAHWAAYSRIRAESPHAPVFYARVLDPDHDGIRAVQYWFCYYYNDWANTHEGDWESVVVLLRDGIPVGVAASQHDQGEFRACQHVEWQGERPVLYVAVGSHAVYFDSAAHVAERPVAGLQLTALDATLLGRDVLDFIDFTTPGPEGLTTLDDVRIALIPDPDPASGRWGHVDHDPRCEGGCADDFEWLNFAGHWGVAAVAVSPGSSGPRGPAFNGLKWDNPRLWTQTTCRPCRACGRRRDESG